MKKKENNNVVYKEGFIQQLQRTVLSIKDQDSVLISTITTKYSFLQHTEENK